MLSQPETSFLPTPDFNPTLIGGPAIIPELYLAYKITFPTFDRFTGTACRGLLADEWPVESLGPMSLSEENARKTDTRDCKHKEDQTSHSESPILKQGVQAPSR
jgi:hypothetical protein